MRGQFGGAGEDHGLDCPLGERIATVQTGKKGRVYYFAGRGKRAGIASVGDNIRVSLKARGGKSVSGTKAY